MDRADPGGSDCEDIDLERVVDEFLDRGRTPTLLYQPVVDLRRLRAIGHEALSRFPGPPDEGPEEWFAAAHRIGRGVELEAIVVEQVIAERARSSPRGPLGVNVSPSTIQTDRIRQLLRNAPMSRLIFELTEHDAVGDYDLLADAVDRIRGLDGLVAVDDVGSAYSNVDRILQIRPDFVKLDRSVVAGLQTDDAQMAVVELFGNLSSTIHCWLIAEGIEHIEELHILRDLDIALGQGYLLGRPSPTIDGVDPALLDIVEPQMGADSDTIGDFMIGVPAVASDTDDRTLLAMLRDHPEHPAIVVVDDGARPVGIVLRDGSERVVRHPPMVVSIRADTVHTMVDAGSRPPDTRHHPMVCCDEHGVYCGIAQVADIAPGGPTSVPRRVV